MAHQQRHNENSNDDDEMNNRNSLEQKISSDGLELVPTILKIKQIIILRYSDFVRLLNDFNKTLEMFTSDEQYYLRFTIVPHSDSTIFWKALIRITCSKVNLIKFKNFFFQIIFTDFKNRSKYIK
jgi:hypothetical protein